MQKFHKTRVPVVQKTWGKQTKHIRYYSEEADESIPTIDVGVPNAEGGHCAKTYAILVRTVWQSHIDNKKWLVITDDDTLLSVPRLRRLLACYDPTEPIALGERYGYGVNANYGYDYVTSGGGMVFSLLTVRQLLGCRCSTPNSPDDMHFGMCLKRLNIPVTHSPLFHQLRPADYAPGYLSSQLPVSFHKHWNCDPLKEYTQWLAADDDRSVDTTKEPHLEL
ncbi:Beta-1,3-glucosyltransferase [Lamellibrachia satsuma]|nr:Beta-1,3-glucosyltransferase [Lamellibrachia satsuma]